MVPFCLIFTNESSLENLIHPFVLLVVDMSFLCYWKRCGCNKYAELGANLRNVLSEWLLGGIQDYTSLLKKLTQKKRSWGNIAHLPLEWDEKIEAGLVI